MDNLSPALADGRPEPEFSELRGPWRATLALALHVGFFVLPIFVVLGVFAVAAITFHYSPTGGLRAAIAALVVATPIVLGLRTVLRPRTRPCGVPVDRKTQPNLWRMAEALASAVGARTPDEIRITSQPRAGVREETKLLGLRTRARYLEIGLPLIAGLTVGELRAVVAHELGCLVGRRKITARASRVAISVRRTDAALTAGPAKWLFGGYARVFAAITSPLHRDVELAADVIASMVAGKREAAVALRKSTAIELGWSDYADEYLSMAISLGHAPEVALGFQSFMEHPRRKKEFAERAKRTIAEESPSDDYLPLRERLERMKRLPNTERKQDDRAALALLREPRKSLPALENRLMVNGLAQRMPWQEIARQASAAQVAKQAGTLSSAVARSGVAADPTIGAVMAAIYQGQGTELINPVLDPGLPPDDVAQAAIDTLTRLLGAAVVDALVCAGRAQHELDWAGPCPVRLATGTMIDPDRLVRPAITDPRLIPGLHRTLVELGVPLQHARPPADDPEPALKGLVSPMRLAGVPHEMLVTDRGLLLIPTRPSIMRNLLAGVLERVRRAEIEQLEQLEATPVGKLRQLSGAQWADNRDIAEADLVQRRRGWSLTLELYLDDCSMSSLDTAAIHRTGADTAALRLQSTADSEERGDPHETLEALMGARMRVDHQHRARSG